MAELSACSDAADAGTAGQPSARALPLHLRIMSFLFGVMFLMTLVICGHLMCIAEPPPRALLARFFTAMDSGRADEVLALCDPALQARLDQPALAAWLAAAKQNLGALKTVTEEEPKEARQAGGPAQQRRAGRLICGTGWFERGSVYAELHHKNGRLTDLVVRCEELPPTWCSAWR